MTTQVRPIEILLVEDNPADVELAIEKLRVAKVCNAFHVARDGIEAMDFLHARGRFDGVARPDVILLDLNLPRKDGREVLADIREDEALRRIPVVVLTSSSAHADIVRSYDLDVAGYLQKPIDVSQFVALVEAIGHFWLAVVEMQSDSS
jgi:chemotaxis family two-component system response regulator Rcp1